MEREEKTSAGKKDDVLIDVRKIARLSRLEFSEEETRSLEKEMNAIVAFADQLSSVDTSNVDPSFTAPPLKNVFREDVPSPFPDASSLLEEAPTVSGRFITVPRVVGE